MRHVSELLASANTTLDPAVRFELLRQAELRSVTDARTFLLEAASWNVCEAATIWKLRKVYNQHCDGTKLWVPLTA